MLSSTVITYAIIATMVVLFVTNVVPTAVTALLAALSLYATGVLTLDQALSGFGDRTVLFIASLLVVSASLDATGVTAWTGQVLVERAGNSQKRLVALTALLAAGFAALIGVSGAVAALMPLVILIGLRLRRSPSTLLMPMLFAAHAGSMLVLTGSAVNLIVSNAAARLGQPPFSFFSLSLIGVVLVAGAIGIVVYLGSALVPVRSGRTIADDLSRHSATLTEQYNLFDGLFRLTVTADTACLGKAETETGLDAYPELGLVAIQGPETHFPRRETLLALGDVLLVRGAVDDVRRFADEQRFALRETDTAGDLRGALFNATSGLAEVVIPPRSGLIGQRMFPGMITPSGDLMVMAIQRRGETLRFGETEIAAGDTLLLRGNWRALDEHLQDPDVLVVDNPDLVRRQAVPMGAGSKRAVFVLVALVLMLASGLVPPVFAGLLCASAVVLLGVLRIDQAYRAVNWTAIIMIASLMPLSTAMYETGAASRIADILVSLCGSRSIYALLTALFLLTAIMGQVLSSAATALIMIPVATAAATEIGVSSRTALVTVAVAAAASFMTPIASGANLIVQGPGGYRFGDYWRLGLPLMLWFFVVGTFLVPLVWRP